MLGSCRAAACWLSGSALLAGVSCAPEDARPDHVRSAALRGARELAALLSTRREVSRCFTRQWLQYALDRSGVVRDPVPPAWVASLDRIVARFEASGLSLRELILAVIASEAFVGP
jgi:hypothetical protein